VARDGAQRQVKLRGEFAAGRRTLEFVEKRRSVTADQPIQGAIRPLVSGGVSAG
jgi:hypothetical protein